MRRRPRLVATVGSLTLPNPVMTASGTSGHGAELGRYGDLSRLGAVVVKSLAAEPWAGNPAPRLHEAPSGMLNSVGLQGPGVEAWLEDDLPALAAAGARVVASIWGRTVDDFAKAATALAAAPASVVAVEVNLSCPNLEGGRHLFAHSAPDTAAAIEASLAFDRPLWAKLTAGVADLVEIAAAAVEAGAEALTLINTLPAMAIDVDTKAYRLGAGAGGGGLSGPAIHPVAVRAVHDVHAARPDVPIVGVGGVVTGTDAVELLLAGASAVQVGTAIFADPRAPWRVLDDLARWCAAHDIGEMAELVGAVHDQRFGKRLRNPEIGAGSTSSAEPGAGTIGSEEPGEPDG
jgi:dihydroorotate dehydrogenase (NAD+) catalytic subunit